MAEIKEIIDEDYVHSANSLFHFMSESKYLIDALKRRALCPRYFVEDVSYLNIQYDGDDFERIAVLQKCFCDIPLGSIIKRFPIRITDKSITEQQRQKLKNEISHTDLYGGYGLAFSKPWGEKKKLQTIQYLSNQSERVSYFSKMINEGLLQDNTSDDMSDALLNEMCYLKPLRGTMRHNLKCEDGEKVSCEISKNFHDEHEWRYVPFGVTIDNESLDCLLANGIVDSGILKSMSDKLEDIEFKETWLTFEYEDIRYIIVPDNASRREIIDVLNSLSIEVFDNPIQCSILISKILVLEEIKKDF